MARSVVDCPTYDRQLLLLGPKRNAILELAEIERYGRESYGDPDYVSIYGMRPAEWYAMGVRLLGRTAVECTRDALGHVIAREVATVAASASERGVLVLDPFAGSGNTLYWLLRHLPGARGEGFEVDGDVFALTQKNLATLGRDIHVQHADYRSGLAGIAAGERLVVAFIAPPWGHALHPSSGLDLRRTEPPIAEVVDLLGEHWRSNRLLVAVQVFEKVDEDSLAEVRARFAWSALRLSSLNAPGSNHGILMGTMGWRPREEALS